MRAMVFASIALLGISLPLAAQEGAAPAFPATGIIRGENIWLRADPASATDILMVMQRGDAVTIREDATSADGDRYYPIELAESGNAGWVRTLFVDPESIAPLTTVPLTAPETPTEPLDGVADIPVPVEADALDGAAEVPAPAEPDAPDAVPAEAAPAPETADVPPQVSAAQDEPREARTERRSRRDRQREGTAATEFASGGLGLSMEAFTARYGESRRLPLGHFFALENGVMFAIHNDDLPIQVIDREFATGVSIDEARAASQELMPEDAVFQETIVTSLGVTVDLYTSESLLAIFPTEEDWPGAEPGQFSVGYFQYDPDAGVDQVTTFSMATGNSRPG
jgi:hypothetical protein